MFVHGKGSSRNCVSLCDQRKKVNRIFLTWFEGCVYVCLRGKLAGLITAGKDWASFMFM